MNYTARRAPADNFYDLCPRDGDGNPFPFSNLKGKVVLIVNIAADSRFTPQNKELEELYSAYKDQGLEILGFPCSQFGSPGIDINDDFNDDAMTLPRVNFPVMETVDVNGVDADPVFTYLKERKPDSLGFKGIKWNFAKFLIDKDGEVLERYSSLVQPASLHDVIKKLLPRKEKDKEDFANSK